VHDAAQTDEAKNVTGVPTNWPAHRVRGFRKCQSACLEITELDVKRTPTRQRLHVLATQRGVEQ
jgi:hypothetical protein